jgi:hypothetical protein
MSRGYVLEARVWNGDWSEGKGKSVLESCTRRGDPARERRKPVRCYL